MTRALLQQALDFILANPLDTRTARISRLQDRENIITAIREYLDQPEKDVTLRDYFAAKAMQGMLSDSHTINDIIAGGKAIPKIAYRYADVMLKEREKKE